MAETKATTADTAATDRRAEASDRPLGGPERPRRSLGGVWWWILIGVAAALVGLLPWLLTGMRLIVQNLWATEGTSSAPIVLLPFSQYAITLIIGLLVVGGGVAGLVSRIVGRRRPPWGFALALVGVLVVQGVALVQTTVVVGGGLEERAESQVYLLALTTVGVLSILVSTAAAALIAKAPRGGAVIGLAIAACALAPWLSGLIAPIGSVPSDAAVAVLGVLRWVPAILVGMAIAWAGVGTIGRVLGALVALGLIWLVPALTTGIVNAAGARVLDGDVAEMLDYGTQVFTSALTNPAVALPPVVLAIVVAAIGLVIRAVVGRAHRSRTADAED